jgi:hypothetical protein
MEVDFDSLNAFWFYKDKAWTIMKCKLPGCSWEKRWNLKTIGLPLRHVVGEAFEHVAERHGTNETPPASASTRSRPVPPAVNRADRRRRMHRYC